MYKFSLLSLLLLSSICLRAQVIINYQPAINGQTLDGLSFAQIVNTGEQVVGAFKITVKDGSNAGVVSVLIPELAIHPGVNTLNKGVLKNAGIRFGESPAATLLSQSGRFPEGEYEYCFEFSVPDYKPSLPPLVYENCFSHNLQPTTPLLLIDPYDGAEICNTRPPFSWQPPMPFISGMRYRIVVVPMDEKQDLETAISNNQPVINKGDLRQNTLNFPPASKDLVKDQQYAWQVIAYTGNTVINKSDIWSFVVKCEDKLDTVPKESYRMLVDEQDGSFYVTARVLHVSFYNYKKAGRLEYEIVDLANPSVTLKRLPVIPIQPGLNKMDLDLGTNPAFIKGHQYMLKVSNVTNHPQSLRFIYQEN